MVIAGVVVDTIVRSWHGQAPSTSGTARRGTYQCTEEHDARYPEHDSDDFRRGRKLIFALGCGFLLRLGLVNIGAEF